MSLLSVQGDNTDKLFGILADTSILGVTVKNPLFTFNKALPTPQGFDDFLPAMPSVGRIRKPC